MALPLSYEPSWDAVPPEGMSYQWCLPERDAALTAVALREYTAGAQAHVDEWSRRKERHSFVGGYAIFEPKEE